MHTKKFIATLLVMVMSVGFSVHSFAAQQKSPYESILNSINEEYNLELGYVPVDPSISIEEYKETTLELAIQQRKLLDYIEARETADITGHIKSNITPLATETKTITKDVWDFEAYNITVTYNINGSKISSYKNAKLKSTLLASIQGSSLTKVSSPTYKLLDSSRTLSVKYIVDMYFNNGYSYKDVVFYTEFYYDDSFSFEMGLIFSPIFIILSN